MKNLFEFIEEYYLGVLGFIGAIALISLITIFEIQLSKTDLYDIEERCYNFYKENNYVLNECSKYENKLKGMKD